MLNYSVAELRNYKNYGENEFVRDADACVWNFVERVLCNSIHLLFAATPLC